MGMSSINVSFAHVPLAFLGLPSLKSIVAGFVKLFFQDTARALVPGFLKNATVATIKWLVALPDPTTWTHVSQLATDMSYVAVSLLAVSFTASIVRYLIVGLTGAGHPLHALGATLTSAAMLVGYRWGVHEAVATINTLTNSILSFPIVGTGLQQTVGILFGSALLVGSTGIFLALVVIVGVVFAATMFALKVLLLLGVAFLYVVGQLVIATRPLPELSPLSRAWASLAIAIVIVPIGWTLLFATAGALSLDATSFGSVGHTNAATAIPTHIAGAFAALLTFYLAVKLPLGVLSQLRGSLGGFSLSGASTAAGSGRGGGGGLQRISDAHARLRTNALGAGRAAGLAAGALGAPAGGPLGAAGRTASRLSAPLAASALAAGSGLASRASELRGRFSRGGGGTADGSPSRGQALSERVGRARQTFTRVLAMHRDGKPLRAGARRGAGGTRFGTGAGDRREPARVGGSGSASPPRPPQRAAPAGEGNTRASSATGRGGSSDGTAPAPRSVDGPNTHRTPASSRDEGLAADASARRDASRPAKPKPPRAEPTPGGNRPSGTRSGNPQRGGRGKASPPPPRTNPPRGPRGGSGGGASPTRQTDGSGKPSRPPRTEGGGRDGSRQSEEG